MIPRRGAVALALTAVALILVLSFKTPTPTVVTGGSSDTGGTPTLGGAPPAGGGAAATTATGISNARGGQFTGAVAETMYGPVQVQITISNGKVTDVAALQLPSDRPRSAEISQYAAPILRSEALQAQSAQVDAVSGATYTSQGYEQSLQSALDQAHG